MKELLVFIRENSVWLHHVLIEYKLIYWDLWSVVHFWCGALVFACLSAVNCKKRWKWLLIILTGFEVLEATVFIGVLKLFMPEKIPDVFMDIFVGIAGGYLAYYVFERANLHEKPKRVIVAIISSAIIAFFWTGYHGYQLNIEFGNFTALNLIAFVFWWFVGLAIIIMCRYFYEKFNNLFYAILTVFILVSILFIPINYLISDVLYIRELSKAKSFSPSDVINIHSSTLKFTAILPVLLLVSYAWFNNLSKKMFAYTKSLS